MTQLTQWHRDVAAKFADAFPMTRATPIRASGNSLAAENDEGEPKYIRTPELDTRTARGDVCNGNAWREVETGKTRYFKRAYDPNKGRWLRLDDVEGRERIDCETRADSMLKARGASS
jgi:hypothetical protein